MDENILNQTEFMCPPLVQTMLSALYDSVDQLKERITDIEDGPIEEYEGALSESVLFKIDGKQYKGYQIGRNRDLRLGHNDDFDKTIVCRIILDGHSIKE